MQTSLPKTTTLPTKKPMSRSMSAMPSRSLPLPWRDLTEKHLAFVELTAQMALESKSADECESDTTTDLAADQDTASHQEIKVRAGGVLSQLPDELYANQSSPHLPSNLASTGATMKM